MVQNPTIVQCKMLDDDYSMVTGFEIDTLDSNGGLVGTLKANRGTIDPATGVITIGLALLPATAGKFRTVLRAVADDPASGPATDEIKSPDSQPSQDWHRGPRAPVNVAVG